MVNEESKSPDVAGSGWQLIVEQFRRFFERINAGLVKSDISEAQNVLLLSILFRYIIKIVNLFPNIRRRR
jgi:hypothetical protein